MAEKTIVMDDLLISSALYNLDETLAHYSLRGEISKKIGHALAEAYDKKVFRTIALSAREAHPVTAAPGPEPGGSIIRLGANNQYNAQTLVDAFSKRRVSSMKRICLGKDVLLSFRHGSIML